MRQPNQDRSGLSIRFRGVSYYYRLGKWQCVIRDRGKMRHLGYFDDEIEAARAYDTEARRIFGPLAALNEPLIRLTLSERAQHQHPVGTCRDRRETTDR